VRACVRVDLYFDWLALDGGWDGMGWDMGGRCCMFFALFILPVTRFCYFVILLSVLVWVALSLSRSLSHSVSVLHFYHSYFSPLNP